MPGRKGIILWAFYEQGNLCIQPAGTDITAECTAEDHAAGHGSDGSGSSGIDRCYDKESHEFHQPSCTHDERSGEGQSVRTEQD